MRPISIEIGWKIDGGTCTCFLRLYKEEIDCLLLVRTEGIHFCSTEKLLEQPQWVTSDHFYLKYDEAPVDNTAVCNFL